MGVLTPPVDPWSREADLIEITDASVDVALAAEYPDELDEARDAAEDDPTWVDVQDEWYDYLLEAAELPNLLLLGIEQSCDQGILLPWDMRAVRLWTAPPPLLAKLHAYWNGCPWYVAALQSHFIYWVIRAERAARTGSPHWSPGTPDIPSLWCADPPRPNSQHA